MTGGYTMKEKNIRELAKRMGLITVENMCQYTISQLVVMVANKVNELVGEVWRFETDVQEILKTQNENIQYLLGEGLHLEVENIFDGWVKDGTFDTLLNHSALKKVNDRIDETNVQLSLVVDDKIYVDDFDDIEKAFDYAKNYGGTIVLSNKVYEVVNTLVIDLSKSRIEGNYATLSAKNGGDDLTVIRVIGSGTTPYNQNANYINNLTIEGKGRDYNQIAIHFNSDSSSRATSHLNLSNLNIHNLSVGIKYDSYTYLIRHYAVDIYNCDICLLMDSDGVDYGENLNYYGCTLYNSNICVKGSNPNGSFHFNSCSLDYSSIFCDITNGQRMFFANGHIEGSGIIKGNVVIANSWLVLLWRDSGHFDVSDSAKITITDSFVNTNAINRTICIGDGIVNFKGIRHLKISDLSTNLLNSQSSSTDSRYIDIFATEGTGENTSAWDRPNCVITRDNNQHFYTISKQYGSGSPCAVTILIPRKRDSSRVNLSFKMRSQNGELESKVTFQLYECVLTHSNDILYKMTYNKPLKSGTFERIDTSLMRYSVSMNDMEVSNFATHYVLKLNLFYCEDGTKLNIQELEVFEY